MLKCTLDSSDSIIRTKSLYSKDDKLTGVYCKDLDINNILTFRVVQSTYKRPPIGDWNFSVRFTNFCLVARSGYHGIKSGSLSTSSCSQHWNFHINFTESLKFLGSQVRPLLTKIRYPQPILGSLRISGYR